MHEIENLLKRTMGLDAASIGPSLICQIVRARMQQCGLKELADYTRYLHDTPTELNLLMEAAVVKETWFFRDQEPFTALVRLVWNEWLPTYPVGPLRILSVPCSTGEEPYSLAMALLDGALPADRFQIDAMDISANALAVARHAVYRQHSFRGHARVRGQPQDYRERHFQALEDGYLLNQTVRDQVRFQQGNILDSNCLDGSGIYDYIFCRNLLIYFDRPTQEKVLQKLARLLKKTGVLFVGPVEQPLVTTQGFVPAQIPLAAACRKVELGTQEGRKKNRTPGFLNSSFERRKPKSQRRNQQLEVRPPPLTLNPQPSSSLHHSPPAELEQATHLADVGKLREAAEHCERHVKVHGASAEAYYLLGLVRDAEGNKTLAMEFYRKALYLEPDHYATLVQMATLSNKNPAILKRLKRVASLQKMMSENRKIRK